MHMRMTIKCYAATMSEKKIQSKHRHLSSQSSDKTSVESCLYLMLNVISLHAYISNQYDSMTERQGFFTLPLMDG